jgi:ribosomal protein S7
MMHGRNNGKKMKAMRIMKQALEIIHLVNPEQNPMRVVVDAVKNGRTPVRSVPPVPSAVRPSMSLLFVVLTRLST